MSVATSSSGTEGTKRPAAVLEDLRNDAGNPGTRAAAFRGAMDKAKPRKYAKYQHHSKKDPKSSSSISNVTEMNDRRPPPPTSILPSTIGMPTRAPWMNPEAFEIESKLPSHELLTAALGALSQEVTRFVKFIDTTSIDPLGDDEKSSHRALKLMETMEGFESFYPVVILVKVLLRQYKLDNPGNGGLSTHQICFLIAVHVEQHKKLDGRDDAGELLANFFFRYGNVKGHEGVVDKARTLLEDTTKLHLPRRTCTFEDTTKLTECVQLFRECWERLFHYMRQGGAYFASFNNRDASLLRYLINTDELLQDTNDEEESAQNDSSDENRQP